ECSIYGLLLSVALMSLLLTGTFGADIVNGQKAKKNSMLYMASVQTDGKHSCGGFLIHPSYVLTAAHCNKRANLKRYKVQNKHKHPSFKDVKTVNDIMLLELSKKLKNGKGMKTIETLSKDKALEPKTKCKVAGWGQTEQENTVNNLLETDVLTINSSICHTLWKEVRTKSGACQVDRWCAVRIVSFSLSQNCDYPNFPNWIKEVIRGGA
uniref:Peptidase S1 domain-containing protein n=1 Tax=Cyprinus carpio carpio TaxID=630221 RepID=A0A8C1EBC7_CYPCA